MPDAESRPTITLRRLENGRLVAASRESLYFLASLGAYGHPDFYADGRDLDEGDDGLAMDRLYDEDYLSSMKVRAEQRGYNLVVQEVAKPDPFRFNGSPSKAPLFRDADRDEALAELERAAKAFVGLHYQMAAGGEHAEEGRPGLRAAAILNRRIGRAEARLGHALDVTRGLDNPADVPIFVNGYVIQYEGDGDVVAEKCLSFPS